jgi:4-carboxymuconolactone decarboxylase
MAGALHAIFSPMKLRIPDVGSTTEHPQRSTRRRSLFAATATVAFVIGACVRHHLERPVATSPGSRERTRHERGLEALEAVGGPDYDRTVKALDALSPDMSRLNVEGPYGDVMSRPGLDLKSRELVNVAAITALASARPALKFHVAGMLNTGWTADEIVETMLHATVYAGFPAALYGMQVAREVFGERGVDYRPKSARPEGDAWQLGIESLRASSGDEVAQIMGALADVAPDLARLTVEFARGEIWSRPGLSGKDRALATLAMVVARGNQDNAVRHHVEACLRAGWTRAELTEVLMQLPVYVGWPKALTATGPALEVFERVDNEGLSPTSDRTHALVDRHRPEDAKARRERGLEALGRISRSSGQAVVKSFDDIAPDLGAYIVEFAYGDVFARPNLDLKTRELATVAALTAKGTAADAGPLEVHVHAALNVGASRLEVVEVILQMLPYAGFVSVQQAMALAGGVFAERASGG